MYNKVIGEWGESLACDYLKNKGYQIIAKNVKLSNQEIDIISSKNEITVFVEVKTRIGNKLGLAEDMVGKKKIKELKIGACNWMSKRNELIKNFRFDFIALDVNRESRVVKIKHYKDIV